MPYDANLSTAKDKLRFMLGDTADASPILSDEEYTAVYTLAGGSLHEAARRLCAAIIARYSRTGMSKTVGPFSLNPGEIVEKYRDLMETILAERNHQEAVMPYSGGMYKADREADATNESLTVPFFTSGIHDADDYDTDDSRRLTGWL